MAALGVPGLLWLGSRRTGHQTLNALAYPALGLLGLTILLSYSRGALLAAAVGAGFWLADRQAAAPARRRRAARRRRGGRAGRGVGVLAERAQRRPRPAGPARAGRRAADRARRRAAGAADARRARHRLRRRRAGRPARARASASASRCSSAWRSCRSAWRARWRCRTGASATRSPARWRSLTDPHAALPINDPSRLTSAGSVRARYWDEALQIFKDNAVVGVGAGGYATVRKRYRTADPAVRHAHGYVVQTLADLGLAGLALSLALTAAWLASAATATGLGALKAAPTRRAPVLARAHRPADARRGRARLRRALARSTGRGSCPPTPPPRCWRPAGCAGRGPLGAAEARRAHGGLRERLRAGLRERSRAIAAGVVVAARARRGVDGVAAAALRPGRPASAADARVRRRRRRARAGADRPTTATRWPSIRCSSSRSIEQQAGNRQIQARAALEQAVRLQPDNPEPWIQLATFELSRRPCAGRGDGESPRGLS